MYKIGIGSTYSPLRVIFLLILITCVVDIVLMTILSGEILFCSHTGVKGMKDPYSEKLK